MGSERRSRDGLTSMGKAPGTTALIGPINRKTAKAFTFLHGAKAVSYAKVPVEGGKIMDALQAFTEGTTVIIGPPVWSYRAAGPGKLALRAGHQVKPGTRGKAPYRARWEPEWICVSARYQGPMSRIVEAWEEFFGKAAKKSLALSDERREIYLKWSGPEASDNVTELQIRLKA
jgi:hypothetical protein